jgi:hypothetical protein
MKPGMSSPNPTLLPAPHLLTPTPRILARQHRPWCHRRQGGCRRRPQVRPPPWIRW